MAERTREKGQRHWELSWLLIGAWIFAGLLGLILAEVPFSQIGLLVVVGGLVAALLLIGISQGLIANNNKYYIVIPALFIGFWLSSQILFNGLPPDSQLLGMLVRWKNYLGVLAVVIGAIFVYTRIRNYPNLLGLFLIWFVFVIVAAISMIRYDYFNWALILMYTGWIAYVSIIIPNLAAQRADWLTLIKYVTVLALVPLVGLILMGIFSGEIYFPNPNRLRITFVFNEPHKYAQFLAVCLVGLTVIIYNSKTRLKRFLLWLVVIALSVLIVLSDSRNTIAFIIAFGFSIYLYKYQYKRFKVWFSIGLFLLFIAFFLLGLGFVDFKLDVENINKLSSNRLNKFDELAQSYLIDAPVSDILFGTSFQSTFEEDLYVVRDVQKAVEEDRYQRAHIENMYYQISLSHGLVGLLAFLIPIGYITRLLNRSLKTLPENKRMNVIIAIASINAVLIQSLFNDTIPSFGNALSIFLPLLWIPPLIHILKDKEDLKPVGDFPIR